VGLRIGVIGAAGRLGAALTAGVVAAEDLDLVGAVSPRHAGRALGAVLPALGDGPAAELTVAGDLEALAEAGADVALEVTGPATVGPHLLRLLDLGIHAVVGATGLGADDLAAARDRAAEGPARAVIAPNFSIGAVLLERLAATAARHLPDVEIVELHHDRKVDAPSGTALATAEAVAAARRTAPPGAATAAEDPARGHRHHGVPIHAVRLPGLVAHQEVLFGASGQVLTLRHDVTDRTAFVPGALLACRRVPTLDGLLVGLGALLD
jgi:4-hydroxy-tetrahydrodipicolinate reductase